MDALYLQVHLEFTAYFYAPNKRFVCVVLVLLCLFFVAVTIVTVFIVILLTIDKCIRESTLTAN